MACSRGSGIWRSLLRLEDMVSDLLGTELASLETDLINSDMVSDMIKLQVWKYV